MFTVVWWNVPHSRTNWLVTFIFLVVLSVVVGLYAVRGLLGCSGVGPGADSGFDRSSGRTLRAQMRAEKDCVAAQCRCAAAAS